MSVEVSQRIVQAQAPLIYPPVQKDDNADPDESDSIVPITTDGTYPDMFGMYVSETQHTETKNPAYTQLPPLGSEYASVGIASWVRVEPDTGGEEGLRDNVPYTGPGPVTGGSTSLGNSWIDGRTLRIRRKAESNAGPVGFNDYASSLQAAMYMSEVQMAVDEASRATISLAV
jgi:hypothetical protein